MGGSANAGAPSGGAPAGGAPSGGAPGDDPLDGTQTEEELEVLLAVRQEHTAVALDGEVYVIGGFTPDITASVQAYNPESDAWRDVADFPTTLQHPNAASVGGLIYVLGFRAGALNGESDERVFAYDPAEDEWTPRMSMPVELARSTACVAVLDQRIYLFGGASVASDTIAEATVYDTESDTWEQLPPLPEPREHCIAGAVDGAIYIVSGRAGSIQGIEPESFVYLPEEERYEDRAPILTPRGGAAGGVLGGKLFVLGGEGNADDPDGIFHEVEAYDPSSDSWEAYPDLLIPRHGYAAAIIDGRIYLPGGATAQGFEATTENTVYYFE